MVRNEKMFVDKVMNHEFDGVILINPTEKFPKMWTCIEDGKIITKRQFPNKRFYNGKETEKVVGRISTLRLYETAEEILEFLYQKAEIITDEGIQATYVINN